MKLHTFKIGGVHPAENKIAAGKPIVNMPLPAEVVLPVAQHIGAPAKPIVAKGDHVKRGDRVAEAGGFVSAHVHTPISGTVVKIDTARTPQGMPVEAIYIKSDEADREADAAAMADTKPKRSDAHQGRRHRRSGRSDIPGPRKTNAPSRLQGRSGHYQRCRV